MPTKLTKAELLVTFASLAASALVNVGKQHPDDHGARVQTAVARFDMPLAFLSADSCDAPGNHFASGNK